MTVMSVGKLSVKPHALFSITKCIGERTHTSIILRRVSVIIQILFLSKKFPPESKPLIVMHGKRPSVREDTLFSMREFTPKRNLMNAMNWGKHLVKFRPHSASENPQLGKSCMY